MLHINVCLQVLESSTIAYVNLQGVSWIPPMPQAMSLESVSNLLLDYWCSSSIVDNVDNAQTMSQCAPVTLNGFLKVSGVLNTHCHVHMAAFYSGFYSAVLKWILSSNSAIPAWLCRLNYG